MKRNKIFNNYVIKVGSSSDEIDLENPVFMQALKDLFKHW